MAWVKPVPRATTCMRRCNWETTVDRQGRRDDLAVRHHLPAGEALGQLTELGIGRRHVPIVAAEHAHRAISDARDSPDAVGLQTSDVS
jgi:hypothetical protein